MSDSTEIVNPADISAAMLHELLDSAYVRCTLVEEEVRVEEAYRFWVCPVAEGKRIRVYGVFAFKPDTDLDARLAYVNSINDGLVMIRASLGQTDLERLTLDFSIPVDGGTTKRAIVYAVKFFNEVIGSALRLDKNDLVK